MIVIARDGIARVGAVREVHDWPLSTLVLLHRGISKGFAGRVLAEPHGCWRPFDESDHRVLPVAYMITKFQERAVQDPIALIVREEGEVEGVDCIIGLGDRDDG